LLIKVLQQELIDDSATYYNSVILFLFCLEVAQTATSPSIEELRRNPIESTITDQYQGFVEQGIYTIASYYLPT